jgi:hypothetical protein
MALTVFFAFCILGVDFMIYVLFQWTWGDKRRAIARRVAAHRKAFDVQPQRPFLVPSAKAARGGRQAAIEETKLNLIAQLK